MHWLDHVRLAKSYVEWWDYHKISRNSFETSWTFPYTLFQRGYFVPNKWYWVPFHQKYDYLHFFCPKINNNNKLITLSRNPETWFTYPYEHTRTLCGDFHAAWTIRPSLWCFIENGLKLVLIQRNSPSWIARKSFWLQLKLNFMEDSQVKSLSNSNKQKKILSWAARTRNIQRFWKKNATIIAKTYCSDRCCSSLFL